MPPKEAISTTKAPSAIGPYSQGIKAGDMVFTSGQLPIDPESKKVPEEVKDQAQVALSNVANVLEAAGASLRNVVKVTVFLLNIKDFGEVNEVYKEFFDDDEALPYPARSAIQVAALPGPVGCKLEIEAVAVLG
ncbi:MAG TPA: Rid family detoxifying hydrolase [bacterium]|nr:Rid family detoxifying hydrolase [bacterium]